MNCGFNNTARPIYGTLCMRGYTVLNISSSPTFHNEIVFFILFTTKILVINYHFFLIDELPISSRLSGSNCLIVLNPHSSYD